MKDAFSEFGIEVPPVGIMIEDPKKLTELYPKEVLLPRDVVVLSEEVYD